MRVASGRQGRWSCGCRFGTGRFGCCSGIFLRADAPSAHYFAMPIFKVVFADVTRIAPHVSSSRRLRKKRPPPWQRSREMHAFRAEDGRIFVLCIRFGVQSGDFGYIACESCRGDGLFVSRSLESCMGRRSCRRSALLGPLPFRRAGQELALQAPDFPPSLRPSCLMASLAMDTEMRTLLSSSMVAWRLTAPLASMATWRLTTPLFLCEKESLPFLGLHNCANKKWTP